MSANMSTEKQLISLAKDSIENEDNIPKLFLKVSSIFNNSKINIDKIMDNIASLTNQETIDSIKLLHDVFEDLSSTNEVTGSDGKSYQAELFAVPIAYIQKAGTEIKKIKAGGSLFTQVVKEFRASGIFPEQSNVFLHSNLYMPEQLMEVGYRDIRSLYQEMLKAFGDSPTNLDKIELPLYEEKICDVDTLMLRYLVGVRIYPSDFDINITEENINNLKSFNTKVAPTLSKIMGVSDLNVISVDSFFVGVRNGLEFYTSLIRKFDIETVIDGIDEPIYSFEAILKFNLEDLEQSKIDFISLSNEGLSGKANMHALIFQDPEELIRAISSELEDMGINIENIYVMVNDKKIPVSLILEENPEVDGEVLDFLNNPTVG